METKQSQVAAHTPQGGSSAKPTPGPWRSRELGSEGARIFPDYGDIRERGKIIADVRGRDTLTDFANARLIAAAPDLLEACKCAAWVEAEAGYGPGTPEQSTLSKECLAAIAKATGDK